MNLLAAYRSRFQDVLGSIYIYNEHRGYTSLDRVLDAARRYFPDDTDFIKSIEKHRADEEKHYRMFRRWFELQGKMPLRVDRTCGHIDRFIQAVFGCTIEELDTDAIITNPEEFQKLCRVIVLTEQRGMTQVLDLLGNPHVTSNKALKRIFEVIEVDEPDHYMPYEKWLISNRCSTGKLRERWADYWIHKSLLWVKLPTLFFRRSTPRLQVWPHEDNTVYGSA